MARRRSEEARRIGARIAALRERHHLTQEAAATKLKVAYRTYQSWEQGTSVPRWAMRERLAKFYKVPVEEINGPALPSDDVLERLEEKIDLLLARMPTLEDSQTDKVVEELEALPARLSEAAAARKRPASGRSATKKAGGRRKSA